MTVEIEDTYAEASDGLYLRILVTADDRATLRRTVEDATATPSIVIGRIEGGIEKYVDRKHTPDKRWGAILQFWISIDEKKPLTEVVKKFYKEFSYRVRQDILVKPFTSVFDACNNSIDKIDTMDLIGHCGDGFEWIENIFGREMITVPIMVPDFRIERYLSYGRGVIGGNFWYMCSNKKAVMKAGRKALAAIRQIEEVITPFEICSAGSKVESNFPQIGPTTNHFYCPSLKRKLGATSKVPRNVRYIPEIVINGTSIKNVKEAVKVGIEEVSKIEGVVKISAGNYGGKLGKYRIYLKELPL